MENESSISMVVRKAFRLLFLLRHLSHGEHASTQPPPAILATTAKEVEDIGTHRSTGHQTGHVSAVVGHGPHERVSLLTNTASNSESPRSFEASMLVYKRYKIRRSAGQSLRWDQTLCGLTSPASYLYSGL